MFLDPLATDIFVHHNTLLPKSFDPETSRHKKYNGLVLCVPIVLWVPLNWFLRSSLQTI